MRKQIYKTICLREDRFISWLLVHVHVHARVRTHAHARAHTHTHTYTHTDAHAAWMHVLPWNVAYVPHLRIALLQRGRTHTGGNWDDRHELLFVWVIIIIFVEERSYRKSKWNRIAKHRCELSCRPAMLQRREVRCKEEDKSVSSIVVGRPWV